jgi:hypothetical protein
MKTKILFALVFLVSSGCWAQTEYTIRLESANPSLALPLTAAGNGVLYVAYRSATWLRRSDKLQVVAFDLNTRKELRRSALSVPEVRGARAADGLYLSQDGKMLAYAEVHDPSVLLLISAKDLTEVRRYTSLPFARQGCDWPRYTCAELFGGFDNNRTLGFAFEAPGRNGIRFLRVDPATLGVVSDTLAGKLLQGQSGSFIWSPAAKTAWVGRGEGWRELSEDGGFTGQEFWVSKPPKGPWESYGAVALGKGRLVAFFGGWDQGTSVSYDNHQMNDLNLPCAPFQYGISNDPEFAGALCVVSHPTKKELWKETSSEFLLLKTDGPSVVWREKSISLIAIAETDKHGHEYYQKGNPLIYRDGKKIYVVAVSRAPELKVYVVPLPG